MKTIKYLLSADIRHSNKMFLSQAIMLGVLAVSFLIYAVFDHYNPEFFNLTDYWCCTTDIVGSVLNYWQLFLYAAIISIIFCTIQAKKLEDKNSEELLVRGIFHSIFAGTLEEIGFRGVFIFTSMLMILFSNWAFVWLFTILFSLCLLGCLTKDVWIKLLGVFFFGTLIILVWNIPSPDPVFWLYEKIFLPFTNFVTFGYFKEIIYGDYPFLFVCGMLSANAKFRDGHKYQGPFGLLNSWIIGFIMLHIMLNHGIVVAIITHAIYDIEVFTFRYIFRKINGKGGV